MQFCDTGSIGSYLCFGHGHMVSIKSWAGIEVGKGNVECICMVLSLRGWCMCCGDVQHIYDSGIGCWKLELLSPIVAPQGGALTRMVS